MRKMHETTNWRSPVLSPPGRRCASLSPRTSCVAAVRCPSALSTSGAPLAARVASASVASASALNAWTSRSVIVHLRPGSPLGGLMACLHNLLHASYFPGCEPDLDTARVDGGLREDVFHDAGSKSAGTLIVLLRDVHPQPWLDVFAVLPVHALVSFTFSRWRRCGLLLHASLPRHPCRDVLRRHRDEHTRLRFPARQRVVHLVRCPVARDDATGLVPDVLVVAGRCARDDDVVRGGGWIVNAHGDVIVPLHVEVFQPIFAGDKGQYFPVVPVPIRCQMRMAIPVNRRYHRNVRRGEIGRDLLSIHREPSWQLPWGWWVSI